MGEYKRINDKGITAPKGFLASGVVAGIKRSQKKDLALVFSQMPASSTAVFTKNKFRAAPVIVSSRQLKHKRAQAIVINSGNANAATGEKGIEDAYSMIEVAARELYLSPKYVLVASTGKIGVDLPLDKIIDGIKVAAEGLSETGNLAAAEAILTTDKRVKEIAIEFDLGYGEKAKIGAMVKGSGMIRPDMATMIAVLTTDIKADSKVLNLMLKRAVKDSFNMITVDDDQSTNDTVFLMANGSGDSKLVSRGSTRAKNFQKALNYVCQELAKEIVRDGEGAHRLMQVLVSSAKSKEDARKVAKKIAGSNLVKTALLSGDPNWGRMVAAIGASNASIDPEKVSIAVEDEYLFYEGKPADFTEPRVKMFLEKEEVSFKIELNLGKHEATAWGCDLSEEYIKINAKY